MPTKLSGVHVNPRERLVKLGGKRLMHVLSKLKPLIVRVVNCDVPRKLGLYRLFGKYHQTFR